MPYLLQPYDDALNEILENGIEKKDRTGVGCISVAGIQKKYPLDLKDADGNFYFPIVTGRKVYPKSVFAELLWFISGSTQNSDLEALGAKFWGKWCDESNPKYVAFRQKWGYEPGDFGPIYGFQLRHFGADYIYIRWLQSNLKGLKDGTLDPEKYVPDYVINGYIKDEYSKGFDQLAYMIDILKNDPFGSNGRRCLFSLWNPKDLEKSALPPCHFTFQAIPDGDRGLTGILTQRSCDFPIGVPANIQFYSALTIMLAQQSGLTPREFIHNTNDSHIYMSQLDQVKEYLAREKPDSPVLKINKASDIYSYTLNDFDLQNYNPKEKIDVPVAV